MASDDFSVPEEHLLDLGQFKLDGFDDLSTSKAKALTETRAKKEQLLSPDKLPSSVENFLALYPEATAEDIEAYHFNKKLQDENDRLAEQERIREIDHNRDRTAGELTGDTTSALARGGIQLGGVLYGLTDLLSRVPRHGLVPGARQPTLDEMTGMLYDALGQEGQTVSQQFDKAKKIVSEALDSEPLKLAKDKVQRSAAKRAERNKKIITKDSPISDKVFNTLESFGEAVGDYIDNPAAATDAAIESAPQMLGPGAISGTVLRNLTANITAKTSAKVAERFLASKAGQATVNKIATTSGLSYIAVSEGISNGLQVQGEILSAKHDDLIKSSDYYKELIDEGVSPKRAKRMLADEAGLITTGIAGLFGLVSAKLTGAAKFEGNLFKVNSPLANNIVTKVTTAGTKGAAIEGIEETLQGASGQFASNVGKKRANRDQELDEGVVDSAAAGLVTGSLSGATLASTVATVQGGVDAAKQTSDAIQDNSIVTDIKEEQRVQEAVQSEDISDITNTKSKNYNPESAFRTLREEKFQPTKQEDVPVYLNELSGHVREMAFRAADELKAAEKANDPKRMEQANAIIQRAVKYNEQLKAMQDIDVKELRAAINTIKKNDAPTEETSEAVNRVLGSGRTTGTSNIDQIDTILESPAITETERTQLTDRKNTQIAVDSLNAVQNSNIQKVKQDVINGGPNFLGAKDYLNMVNIAANANDQSSAEQTLTNLSNFTERHTQKANDVVAAYNAVINNEQNAPQLVQQVKDDYGLAISKNSKRLAQAIELEARALNAFNLEANNIYDTTFANAEPQSVEEVQGRPAPQDAETVGEAINQEQTNATVQEAQSTSDKESSKSKSDTPASKKSDATRSKPTGLDSTKLARVKELSTPEAREILKVNKGATKNIDAIFEGKPLKALTPKVLDQVINLLERVNTKIDAQYNLPKQLNKNEVSDRDGKLSDFFEVKGKEGNVLLNNENWFNELRKRNSDVVNQVKKDLTKDQLSELSNISNFERQFQKAIEGDFKQVPAFLAKKDYFSDDLIQYFQNEDGKLDSNFVSQLALVAYDWVGSQGGSTLYNDSDAINSILGKASNTPVSDEAHSVLNRAGTLQVALAESLGRKAISALNIKVKNDAPGEYLPNLEISIGNTILASMLQMDVIQQNNIFSKNLDELANDQDISVVNATKPTDPDAAYTSFIRIMPTTYTNEFGDAIDRIETNVQSLINSASKNTGVMDKLFGVKHSINTPQFDVPKEGPQFIKRTQQRVPKAVKEAIVEHQKKPNSLKENVYNVFELIGEDGYKDIAGYVTDFKNTVNVTRKDNVEGKNFAIERDYNLVQQFVKQLDEQPEGRKTPFYFEHEVWRNMRIGMKSSTINTQASKLHRHLFGMNDHQVKINPNKQTGATERFLLAAAESIGIKVNGVKVDKAVKQDVLNAINEMLGDTNHVITKGILAIKNGSNNKQAIIDATKEGGEKFHSLDGIVALAEYLQAKEDNTEFTTNLYREVDGITNGTAIGLMQLAAKDSKHILPQTGIFFNNESNYNEWANTPGNNDVYQGVAKTWAETLRGFSQALISVPIITDRKKATSAQLFLLEFDKDRSKARQAIIGLNGLIGSMLENDGTVAKLGRDMAKDPVMVTNYHAGERSVLRNFTLGIVDKLHEDVEKAVNSNDELVLTNIKENLIKVLGESYRKSLDKHLSIKNALQFNLREFDGSGKAYQLFENRLQQSYGSTLSKTMAIQFGHLRTAGEPINEALRVAFNAFNIVYTHRVKQAESKLDRDLSRDEKDKIARELSDLMPMYNTPTVQSGERNHGILAMREKSTRSKDKRHKTNQVYNRTKGSALGLKNTNNPLTNKPLKSLSGFSSTKSFTDDGVAGLVKGIHSIDASIITDMLPQYSVLNVHDALAFDVINEIDGTNDFNNAFLNRMKNYDLRSEINKTLQKSLNKLDELSKQDKINYRKQLDEIIAGDKLAKDSQEYQQVFDSITKEKAQEKKDSIDEITGVVQYNNGENVQPLRENVSINQISDDDIVTAKQLVEDIFIEFKKDEPNTYGSMANQQGKAINTSTKEFRDFATDIAKPEDRSETAIEVAKHKVKLIVWPLVADFVRDVVQDDNSPQAFALKKLVLDMSRNYDQKPFPVDRGLKEINEAIRKYKGEVPNYGSNTSGINFDNFVAQETRTINADNSEQLFDDLGTVGNVQETAEHSDYLRSLLNNTVNQVLDTVTVHSRDEGPETFGAAKDNEIFLVRGTDPRVNNIQMSAQETYLHELVHVITASAVDGPKWAAVELKKLFNLAEKHIKPTDFLNNPNDASNPVEMEAAQARYDYIFRNKDLRNGRNNYLHEFLAMGITNKNFINALGKIDSQVEHEPLVGKGFWNGLIELFRRLSDYVTSRITKSQNMMADQKLRVLADQLAGIKMRKANTLGKKFEVMNTINDATIKGINNFVLEPLAKFGNSRFVQSSKSKIVREAGKLAGHLPHIDMKNYVKAVQATRRRLGATNENFTDNLINEAVGQTDENTHWHRLAAKSNKLIDQLRNHVSTNVANQLTKSFHTELTKEVKTSLSKVLLKTDLSVLTQYHSMDDLIQLVKDKSKRDTEIDRLEQLLSGYGNNQFYYQKYAKSLGSIMATSIPTERNSMLNAHNIANIRSIDNPQLVGDINQAEEIIDQLATLHALNFTDSSHIQAVANLMESEHSIDPVNNGITFAMQVHANNKKQSFTRLFGANKALMVKGYTKEIYNPNISYVVAPLTEEATLLKEGFVKSHKVIRDKTDLNKTDMYMFISTDGMVTSYMSGAASLTNKKAKGTDLVESYAQTGARDPALEAYLDFPVIKKQNTQLAANTFSGKITSKNETMMVPIVNELGKITAYRYMMTEQNKDNLLEKDNSFERVLGSMEASIEDKVNSRYINNLIVKEAYDEYQKDYRKDPDRFVYIGKDSKHARYKEIYQMLPQEMRSTIKNTFGREGLYLKDDLVDLIFGYRKFSIANMQKDTALRTGNRKNINKVGELLADKLNHPRIRRIENVWQEIVKVVKDTIVIRSGVVLGGNIASNMFVLLLRGIPVKDVIRDHAVALKGAREYQENLAELDQLKRSIKVNPNLPNKNAVELKIARLTESLATNPVKELIDEGVYQSIIEDIENEADEFSYKTKIEKYVEPVTSKVPSSIKTISKNLFMTHDTKGYKFLRDTTQLSDFVARYTLHNHNLKKGMSKGDSIRNIVDTFINYDLPTHRGMQYANDVGIILFTKFLVRIQKVLVQIIGKHPARVFTLLALQNAFGNVPDIYDTNVLTGPVLDRINTDPLTLSSNVADVAVVNMLEGLQ